MSRRHADALVRQSSSGRTTAVSFLLLVVVVLLLGLGYNTKFRKDEYAEGYVDTTMKFLNSSSIFHPTNSSTVLEPELTEPQSTQQPSAQQPLTAPPPTPVDWIEAHQQEIKKSKQELKELKTRMSDRIMTLNEDQRILSYHELEEQIRPLLRDRGLIFVGDSTSRTMFGFLWCLLDGIYDGTHDMEGGCQSRQAELKEKCRQEDSVSTSNCESLATFSNSSNNDGLHLQYLSQWYLRSLDQEVQDGLLAQRQQSNGRIVFFGMPCLHSLWSPGLREHFVYTDYHFWRNSFQKFYDSVHQTLQNSSSQLFVGTTISICDPKLGQEKELIDAYLRGSEKNEEKLIEHYNHQKADPSKLLPPNYTGTFPVWKDFRANHSCDNALFDEGGGLKCSATGLSVLEGHALFTSTDVVTVLDMHNATANSCDETPDGRHYSQGLPMRRQLTLLLNAIAH